MSHVIGFKLQTISEERRDRVLVALTEILNLLVDGGDEVILTFTAEDTLGPSTKKKSIYTHKWEPGQTLPTLATFEIMERQRSMFDSSPFPDIRTFRALFQAVLLGLRRDLEVVPERPAPAEAEAEAATPAEAEAAAPAAPDDLPAEHLDSKALDPFRRTIEDIERATDYGDDNDDDDTQGS